MDTALREPVTITKHNRPVVVVLSAAFFARLEAIEDRMWLARAKAAEKKGYLSLEESEALVKRMLDAQGQDHTGAK